MIEFCQFVSRADDRDFAARIGSFVDIEAFARYMAVVAWLSNPDSILERGQNYYVYLHPQTRKLYFMPWDQDHSFGNFLRHVARPLRDVEHPRSLGTRCEVSRTDEHRAGISDGVSREDA